MRNQCLVMMMLAASASPASAGDRRVGVRTVELIAMGEASRASDAMPNQTWVLDQMRGAIDDNRDSQARSMR